MTLRKIYDHISDMNVNISHGNADLQSYYTTIFPILSITLPYLYRIANSPQMEDMITFYASWAVCSSGLL
jgi:hypothetical protein